MRISLALSAVLLSALLHAESIDEALDGFDDTPETKTTAATVSTSSAAVSDETDMSGFDDSSADTVTSTTPEMEGFDENTASEEGNSSEIVEKEKGFFSDFSGKLIQQGAIGYNSKQAQDVFASLRQTLFLDYEHKFENGVKFKANVRGFYDPMYDVASADHYPTEVDDLRTEVELFEAYVEWKIADDLDAKLGRQVVVWGRSDTIRITDVLNPMDYRRPGTLDIEDLRLPRAMLKFDYQWKNWTISPIAIVEQRFSKYPPFGSVYYPIPDLPIMYSNYQKTGYPLLHVSDQSYHDVSFALSVGAEFEGWDVNFYAARVRADQGFTKKSELDSINPSVKDAYVTIQHNKTNMFGTALNYLNGSWLFKTEMAYFSNLIYTSTQDRELSRTDGLIGLEYSGLTNTTLSYDIALRHFNQYDERLYVPFENFLEQDTYQQAFRINSNYFNDTLHLNYLVSVFGKKADEGGYQRVWMDYDVADGISTTLGVVDYFGGSPLFDRVENYDILFMDMSYSF